MANYKDTKYNKIIHTNPDTIYIYIYIYIYIKPTSYLFTIEHVSAHKPSSGITLISRKNKEDSYVKTQQLKIK